MRINIVRRLLPSRQPRRNTSGLLVSGLTLAVVALAVQLVLPLSQKKSSDSVPVEEATNEARQNQFVSGSDSRFSSNHSGRGENKGPVVNRSVCSVHLIL